MNIIKLISDFKKNNSMLWVESNNIRLFVADDFEDRDETINTIKRFKPEIVEYLVSNKILSKDDFQKKTIFKSYGNEALLSFAQERLWFIEQYEQGSNAYHIPLVIELEAHTNIAGTKYALQQIVSRHEVLRSTIEYGDSMEYGIQRVHDDSLSFEEITLTNKEDFKSLIEEDINRPFDLSAEYPIKVKFYSIQSQEGDLESPLNRTVLLINFHHIASDGWSIEIFQKEWGAYYDAYINVDPDFNLPNLDIQYKDYAIWQRSFLSGEILEKQLRYWRDKVAGYQVLEMPADHARPAEIDYRGSNLEFPFGKVTSQKLRALAQHYGVTLHSVMLSSVNILLSKYTGQEDIITGSVIANRHHRQTEALIGFFVNTQVNRTLLNRSQSFAALVQQVHCDQAEAQLYQDLPFEKLVQELGVERDPSRHPVFQVMFGMENFSSQYKAIDETYLKPVQAEVAYDVEKFDLSIDIDDSQNELLGKISYATALFNKDTIERLILHYKHLLEQLAEAPEVPYSQHSLLATEEYERIIYDWNDTDKDYPKDKTIYQLFQEQAEKTPGNIALVYEGQQLSYRELNEKTNQLAHHIREQYQQRTNRPLETDTLIALYLDRSLEMVIGILAVLKAGGAYVPMDIYYPAERIDYILEDTKAALILSQRQLNNSSYTQLPADKVLYIDFAEQLYKKEEKSDLPQHCQATDLAYLIYTSGSSGKPKAVAIEHRSVVNMALGRVLEYNMTERENSLQIASICFDASVEQIFVALFCGAKLTLIKKEVLIDGEKCELFLNENKITHLDTVPSFLETLDFSKLKYLKRIASGGESCTVELVNRILPHIEFYNEYGPTEATVITTQCKIEKGKQVSELIPIGKPIQNAKVFILDNYMNVVPTGIVGEIYIGGDVLARGYLNSDKLTTEKFVLNPFGPGRLYKTGDLGRWRNNGQIEYIGRKDNQVKIRGFRIELGEIEHALSQISGIRQSVVLAKERKTASGSNKYLVAYYILDKSDEKVNQAVILNGLSKLLPEYMLPDAFVEMPSFPITINGKLDVGALPEPDFSDGDNYVKPNTELETRLCQVYADVLGLAGDQISTHQNFFRMGGNSILSIRLKGKLSQLDEFKQISVADLFKYNSINKLIGSLQKNKPTEYKGQLNGQAQSPDHEIAIIGVSGAFSGAANVDELWQLISNQLEGIRLYSKEECRQLGIDEALLTNPDYIPVQGKVEDIELFDPSFWEISPNEAKQLDPQIRKFIEHCWFALESSGYAPQRKDHHIGVFAGSGYSNYFNDHVLYGEMADQINMWEASASNSKDALATKVAYHLDLTGPANSINTACSTGLVSVVEACKNLQLGTCNMALAGGVSLSMPYQIGYFYEDGMILSKDGHCRTFDSEASGTTGGSGVAVVLLKRLKDSIKDNDNILAVVKGYATNNDGSRKTGYAAPSLIGQSECIINAQAMAGIRPGEIDYVECHGTATNLGDPIEIQALSEAFQYNQSKENAFKHTTVLGAIKANIGHTDSAAGTAGLIKVVTMLQHNILPGQVNFNEPNPELHLDRTSFEIIKENRHWLPGPGKQRLAGVSSFGIGGTNAHVVIGEYMARAENDTTENKSLLTVEPNNSLQYIVPISAKSRQSLERYKKALAEYLSNALENNETLNLADMAYTLSERRAHFNFRAAYSAATTNELISRLREDVSFAETNTENTNKIVFMFPGQGAQYTQMAKELYDNDGLFKNTIDHCIALANQHLPMDLFEVIYPQVEPAQHDINEIKYTPVSLFIIEYALAKYLEQQDVKATAYIGHSFGEYVAATLAGVFSLADAIKILITRGRLMQAMPAGSMLSVNAKEEAIKSLVKEHGCEISLINSPEDVVVSGTDKDIKKLQQALEKKAIPVVKLNASVAGHSRLMDPAAIEFEKAFMDIKLNKPVKDFVSNVTGEIAGEEVTTASYWSRQLRNTVQFAKGINTLSKQYNHQVSFIEVGTGKGLGYFVNKHKTAYNHKSIQTVQLLPSAKESKAAAEGNAALNIKDREDLMARLWMYGIIEKANNIDLFKQARLLTDLPSYQFDYQECWLEKGEVRESKKFNSLDEMFYERTWERASLKISAAEMEELKNANILVFVNQSYSAQSQSDELLKLLKSHCSNLSFVLHQQANNTDRLFDFSNAMDIADVLNEKTAIQPINLVIYISSSIDLAKPGLDIFAVKNIFNWSKDTGNEITKFISISIDNYEVTGNETLQEKPSVIYGVTKSIPFEYFTSGTKAFHIDLSAQDDSYKNSLLAVLAQNEEKDLFVLRGKYQWFPTYQQAGLLNSQVKATNGLHSGEHVYLITGGLGGIGYAYAKYLVHKEEKCTIILLGRTKETGLRSDYKTRLTDLRKGRHQIIYSAIDIGHKEAFHNLERLLATHKIDSIEVILHSAGIGAKSALFEKTSSDIEQVIDPKISGVESLLNLARIARINNMVCCSSLTSIIPSLGNMEYTAANLYLDEISQRSHEGIKYMVAINLNQVSDTGMAIDFMEKGTSTEGMSLNSIRSQDFPRIVEMLLQTKTAKNIVLSRYDFNTEHSDNAKLFDHLNKNEIDLNVTGIRILEENYTDTEYKIAQIFGEALGIEQISVHDDFFGLGGNSIHAIHVSHRMSKVLNCEVRVADVFKYKTISQLQRHSISQAPTEIPVRNIDRAVLSFAQERLWFIEQYEGGSNAYHIPAVYELDGGTDIAGIKYALQQIVSRHEVLRSTIRQDEQEQYAIQLVHDEPLSLEEITLTDKEDAGPMIEEDINRPFDLGAEYPIRAKFYHIRSGTADEDDATNKTLLLINTHHIASDGWSIDIFERELFDYYDSYVNKDEDFYLPPLEIQYKDYAIWQRTYLSGENLERQLGYWKDKLSGYQPLELPTDHARPAAIDYSGSRQGFIVDEETSLLLRELAQRHGVTLYSVLLSSLNILLSKYTGQEDIITGSVIANRHHRQTEGLIGFFVNTLVNRTLLDGSQSFEELVQQVHQDQAAAQLHQDLPFEKLVEELGVERDPSRHPVFQVMFGLQSLGNQGEVTDEQKNYITPLQEEVDYYIEKFDLSVNINDNGQDLFGQISYATALFDKATIEKLVDHFTYLLAQLAEAPEQPYSKLSLLTPEEYEQVIYDWNDTDKDYPAEKTICQLFNEQTARTPDNIALVFEGQKISYGELDKKSNQLARHIRDQYLQKTDQPMAPGTPVALCLGRSPEMVIGMLAILKAGGAYVPIDASYPQERIDHILTDTNAPLVLSQRLPGDSNKAKLPEDKVLYIGLSEELYDTEEASSLPQYSQGSDLAYLIYTSGSTGMPKGVMVEHRAISSLVFNDYIKLSGTDVFAFMSSPVFDAATFEVWAPLLNGNPLIVPADLESLVSDVNAFKAFIALNNVSILWLTKTLFESLYYSDNSIFESLNYLITGGEALDKKVVGALANSPARPTHFLNGYGPTESTTFTCIFDLSNSIISSNVPIGAPINNRSVYVLGPGLSPVPIGIIGELYIGGAGLARGYLNQQSLTEERFVDNPFATEEDQAKGHGRLYKTGDLVRWLPDGNLEYIGRNDEQVKINGHRIELGEIEHALSQLNGIRQSCVMVKERETASGTIKYLVGYYILDNNGETNLSQAAITDKLSGILPVHMVPAILVAMDSFPFTINGKLDKRALPEPDFSDGDNYVQPGTELEARLCQVYAEVLGLTSDQISTHQNFFRMGGNSILSIRLKGKLTKLDEFKHISVADLFKYNTINKLIGSIQKNAQTEYKDNHNPHKGALQNYDHEIAIISVSGAFSGAANVEELWELVSNQQEGIRFYSKEECSQLGIDEALLEDPDYIPVEGRVEGIELFDPPFWEISPNEAKLLDPQIRKFIEHCWFALESSGYAHQRKNHHIGVFAGSGHSNYFYDHILHGEMAGQINMWEASISNSKDALATKTAFLLGLSGSSHSINTACSTGLVSVVEACRHLMLGTCNMALAGGVSLSLPGDAGYVYQDGMILSKDGHCRTFDSEASGTTGGSGVAVVLLKRLKDAIKDNDNILAVVKGYATNNDGDRKTGYTAPSLIGQSECIISAQTMAGINPGEIDYVECHGTATNLGDPIEIQALSEAFRYNKLTENSSKHTTVLGAIKANIGHTDSAAGTAGLIKVVAMLQHNILPGQVNFNEPNPELHLDRSNFEIIKVNRPWLHHTGRQRLAGVSSFGVGGTNAHVVIGDYVASLAIDEAGEKYQAIKDNSLQYVIPISAKSRQSLQRYKEALAEYLFNAHKNNETLNLADMAYTLSERRAHFNFRAAYSAATTDDLISKLRNDVSFTETNTENTNKIVFMFPGQGAQYTQMAKELYDNDGLFKNTIDHCIALANQHLHIDLFEVIYPQEEPAQHDINEIKYTPVSLFIIEYALAKYLEQQDIKATAYIGHSFGEYVAATLAGVFSLADAIKILITRGRLMQAMPAGSMLSVNAKEEAIKSLVKEHGCEISLINSPEDVVVSGTDKDIKKLQQALEKKAIPVVKLNASVAGHSRLMDPAAIEFEKAFMDIKLNKPVKDFVSNVTGEIAGEEVTTASYWSRQLRNTVQFAKGINTLSKQYNHQVSFIEVGTGKGLGYFVNKHKAAYNHKSIQTVQLLPSAKESKAAAEGNAALNIKDREDLMARLWMNGIIEKANNIDLFKQARLLTDLPSYQFDYQECWLEKGEVRESKKFNSLDEMFYERTWERASLKISAAEMEELKNANILVFVNQSYSAQSQSDELLKLLKSHCSNLSFVLHQQANNTDRLFDFSNAMDIADVLNEKTAIQPINLVIYISSSIDLAKPGLDIFAVKNIFNWSKDTGNEITKFISISIDNFDVIGIESIQEKPSIIYGVTKSIPFEYFTSGTKAFHIDLSSQHKSHLEVLLAALHDNEEKDLLVIRGRYQWFPTYQQIKFPANLPGEKDILSQGGATYLITGGLGALGYAYANHLAQKDAKCTIILLGRTKEPGLRSDYKDRLTDLRKSRHHIIYAPIDMGDQDAQTRLQEILIANNIDQIEVALHAAGISAISALIEKTRADIEQVTNPKIKGIESLVKLSRSTRINNLVCCSSLTSLMPSLGNMEYTAANFYLDEISQRSHPGINNMFTINLNQISDAGMAVDFIKSSTSTEDMSLNSIRSHDFPGILDKLLQVKKIKNILLSRYDFNTELIDNAKLFARLNDNTSDPDLVEIKIIEDNYTDTEYQIALIFGGILGIEQVSVNDDFFSLGGNSISAIQVSHRMSKTLNCEVRVADIFKYKTISHLYLHSLGKIQTNIPRIDSERAVLSFAQERLWFIEQYAQGSNAYHIPAVYELDAGTDIAGIKYALQQVISRHEILRSTIGHDEQEQHAVQLVHDVLLPFEEITLTDKADLTSLIEEDINQPFDLGTEYPIRAKFYHIKSGVADDADPLNKIILLINIHHIASDGWSAGIFERELFDYYEAYINKDTDFYLPALEIQYKDYAVWQRSYLSGENLEKQLSYWKDKLLGYQPLELPIDHARPVEIDYSGASHGFIVNEETSRQLRELARLYGVTMHCVMLSSIHVLFSKYTGQDDIITGSVIANRHHRQTEGLIGFFVNTLVNRTLLNNSQSFEELVQQVQQDQVEAQLHQDLPFEKLVEELGVERDLSRHPIFQVMFGAMSIGSQDETTDQQKNYLLPLQEEVTYEVEKFDLSIFIYDGREELKGQISYATALFDKDTIERLTQHYTYLLAQLAEAPEQPFSELSLLAPEEYEQIVYDWNDTDKEYPSEKTICQLFCEQAKRTPDNIALFYEGQQLSYRELDEKSNQLARHIREQYQQKTNRSFAPDTLIALYLDRSLEMIISMLAVLKAGGAYVPIDIYYPQERIGYILEDTEAALVLSHRQLNKNNYAQLTPEKVIYVDLDMEFYKKEDHSSLPQHSKATDLAYVIYTSGTTGRPKGVMVEHRSVINLMTDLVARYNIDSSERFLLFANYVFDASVEQIYLSLLSGSALYIIENKSIIDSNSFENYIIKNQITHLHATPSFLSSIDPSKLHILRRVVFGAEYLAKELFDGYQTIVPTIINEYGPTETTITSLVSINSYSLNKATIQNTKAYILDPGYNPVPIGIIGELYLGGAGLARGYLNNPGLTAERFINNPFSTELDKAKGHDRLYKTGDLVRWLPGGNMEYIGRNDSQVKIRGYRIEPGEIEHALSQINGIKQSCVLVKERETASGITKYLVGYYVLDNNNIALSQTMITDKLLQSLPEYMVPAALIEIKSLPLTITGKLDKSALPDPEFKSSAEEYIAPTSDPEITVCNIWQEALGLERVGITDNFFRIGGNSILAIQVSHRMSKALGTNVQVADVFKLKNIQMLLNNLSFKQVSPDNVEWDILINI